MGRRTERLSFSIEGFASRRFDTWDRGVGGDVTTVLWPGAYASVRAQAAPSAATIARTDLGAELTQALPHALEVAPSWRIMRFRDASVAIYGVGLARYAGDWYLRGRMTAAPQSDRTGTAGTLLARRYFGSASDLLEMHVGTGQEVIVLPPPAAAALRRTAFVALRGARTLTPVLVGTVGASLDRDEGLGIRRGVRLGTEVRW
jgi:YaiO family outer membrane protein